MRDVITRFNGRHTPDGMVEYPFPVRPGVVVPLLLPEDMTMVEAARLGRFVESLAVDTAVDPGMPSTWEEFDYREEADPVVQPEETQQHG